jgi:hypothetical protein
MRLVGWVVQPVVMADDGENLAPVQIGPQTVPAARWEAFKAGGDAAALEQVRAQIEGPPPAPGPGDDPPG